MLLKGQRESAPFLSSCPHPQNADLVGAVLDQADEGKMSGMAGAVTAGTSVGEKEVPTLFKAQLL